MRTVGIIAEYNPFHTGHEYHIRMSRELTSADYVVVVISPDFVQRGEPAIFDKYTRTKIALLAGADLVFELPVCYATGSAEYFAEGAVRLLDAIGVTDALCFGVESTEITSGPSSDLFQETAKVLIEEPQLYKRELQRLLALGMTFPEARVMALEQYEQNVRSCSEKRLCQRENIPSISELLSTPNNILGVEYCKALQKFHSQIKPVMVERKASSYSSSDLGGKFCSAKALRTYIKNRQDPDLGGKGLTGKDSNCDCSCFPEIASYIPERARDSFFQACQKPVFPDDLLPFLTQKLVFRETFDDILDISPELSRRIAQLRFSCIGKSFDEITHLLKTKQMTQTRIQRALLHLILDIRKDQVESFRADGTVFYAHVLGFRREASPLLHEIKKRSSLPLITKASRAPEILPEKALGMWKQDVLASHLYRSLLASHYDNVFRTENEISPIVL